ncbi:hypothetical protein VTN77DRAFT_5891 [Rasamsonia byssochlamydoides]|uniref:uncharacterized protein n=1 Tax=Rasamsonia byssochlamydoides TaxID=89139 RepID=UPI00374466B6
MSFAHEVRSFFLFLFPSFGSVCSWNTLSFVINIFSLTIINITITNCLTNPLPCQPTSPSRLRPLCVRDC